MPFGRSERNEEKVSAQVVKFEQINHSANEAYLQDLGLTGYAR
jgi:hypothetical protein